MDQGGGGDEADGKALLTGGQPQAQRDMGFARAGRSGVIVPGVWRLRFGFSIRFTRAAARRSWSSTRSVTLALLPAWMTEPRPVSSYQLVARPWLPIEKLGDLRALVDALMASYAGDLPRCNGAGHAESATRSEGSVRRGGTADGASARTPDQADAVAPSSSGGGGRRRVVSEPIGRSGRRGGP